MQLTDLHKPDSLREQFDSASDTRQQGGLLSAAEQMHQELANPDLTSAEVGEIVHRAVVVGSLDFSKRMSNSEFSWSDRLDALKTIYRWADAQEDRSKIPDGLDRYWEARTQGGASHGQALSDAILGDDPAPFADRSPAAERTGDPTIPQSMPTPPQP